MYKAVIYFSIGMAASFFLNYLFLGSHGWRIDLFDSFSFGLGWAIAYLVDRPKWALVKKLGISFIGVIFLQVMGWVFFGHEELVILAVIKFSTVFMAYYIMASFRESKSLRE